MRDRRQGVAPEARELRCLYLGIGTNAKDGKEHHRWFFMDSYPEADLPDIIENDGAPLADRFKGRREWWFPKVGPAYNVRAGAIVQMLGIVKPDSHVTLWGGTQELLEMWRCEADCARWQAQVWHDRARARSLTEKRQEMTKEMHLEVLKPFREVYQNLRPLEQPIFLANVISYITRGTAAMKEKK